MEALRDIPECLWSQGKSDVGFIKKSEPVIVRAKSEYRPNIRQYNLRPDAREGVRPLIQEMLKGGILRECHDSSVNSPIFPVLKHSTQPNSAPSWRMVLDLKEVNKATQPLASVVPDPHLLLNALQHDKQWFSVVDMANAFHSVKVDENSQFWFAFTYEGKKYTYTRMVQGYRDSPHIYNREMANCLADLDIPESSQVLA